MSSSGAHSKAGIVKSVTIKQNVMSDCVASEEFVWFPVYAL